MFFPDVGDQRKAHHHISDCPDFDDENVQVLNGYRIRLKEFGCKSARLPEILVLILPFARNKFLSWHQIMVPGRHFTERNTGVSGSDIHQILPETME